MKFQCFAAFVFAAVAASAPGLADEVLFKNGDKLTGKVESMEGGKLAISGTVAGKITVDVGSINTFSTAAPLRIRLQDGSTIVQKVNAAAPGQIALAPAGVLAPQNLPLSQIKFINFNDRWTGNIVAAGAISRGNTNTETLNASGNLVRRGDRDRITVDGGYLFGREKIVNGSSHETANDWWIGGKYDYYFTPKFYGYLNARVERDLIAGINLRLTPGGGVGYQWFDRPDFHLSSEGGVSWLYRDYSHDGTDESVALRLAYHVDKKLNQYLTAFHNMEYFPGLDSLNDYYFNADAGLRATITDHLFTEFKVNYKYDARPAPGKGSSDQRFILGVGYNF